MKKKVRLLLYTCFLFNLAFADIKIHGSQSVSAEKIKILIDHVFDVVEAEKILMDTGLFETVKVCIENGEYVVHVVEKKTISEIIFIVNGSIKKKHQLGLTYDTLLEVTRLTPGMIIDNQKILTAKTAIQQFYSIQQNVQYIKITHEIVQNQNDKSYQLVFHITKGPIYYIPHIKYIGVKNLNERELDADISHRKKNFLLLFQSTSPEPFMLAKDLTSLTAYAHNQGFLKAEIKSCFLENQGRQQRIYIALDEGEQYKIRNVTVAVSKGVEEIPFKPTLSGTAKLFKIAEYEAEIVKLYKNWGQHVMVRMEQTFEGNFVDLKFNVTPLHSKYVVSKIIVKGNTHTRSSVILRAAKLSVGSYFDNKNLAIIESRIYGLGFFKNVKVDYQKDEATGGYIIIIHAEDKAVGNIGMHGMFKFEGWKAPDFTLGAFYQHENFLGKEHEILLNVATGHGSDNYTFAYKVPTIFGKEIGWSFSVYRDLEHAGKSEFIHLNFPTIKEEKQDKKVIEEELENNDAEKKIKKAKKKGLSDCFSPVKYSIDAVGASTGLTFDLFDLGNLKTQISCSQQQITHSFFKDEKNISRFFKKDMFPNQRIVVEGSAIHSMSKYFHTRQSIVVSNALSITQTNDKVFLKYSPRIKFYAPFNRARTLYFTSTASFGILESITKDHHWIDNFSSGECTMRGFTTFEPLETNRSSGLGGTKKFNAYAELISPFILPPEWNVSAFVGIYSAAVWDTKIKKHKILPQYAQERKWSKDTLDIAGDDFALRAAVAIGLRLNLAGFKFEWAWSAPLTKTHEVDNFTSFQFKLHM